MLDAEIGMAHKHIRVYSATAECRICSSGVDDEIHVGIDRVIEMRDVRAH